MRENELERNGGREHLCIASMGHPLESAYLVLEADMMAVMRRGGERETKKSLKQIKMDVIVKDTL